MRVPEIRLSLFGNFCRGTQNRIVNGQEENVLIDVLNILIAF